MVDTGIALDDDLHSMSTSNADSFPTIDWSSELPFLCVQFDQSAIHVETHCTRPFVLLSYSDYNGETEGFGANSPG